ncbi:protein fem-1 homolog A-like [Toxorhynchites rutilus septentrionalis]|uniref:protein fem-1 homolog A-like n=1 Tax=Toxorhynchites rutilus septentrionalis TaxID=329112 RepID=UPI002478B336|nr:protein fem-1 homolog A-like [Toxorhynchites rutilus septentrionalis]
MHNNEQLPNQPTGCGQFDPRFLAQIRRNLFSEIGANNAQGLSKNLRQQLEGLPRNVRKEVVEEIGDQCAALFYACESGNVETVDYLVKVCGASIEQRGISMCSMVHEEDWYFCTPLGGACAAERLPVVKYLLELGAAVNGSSECGSTPLHIACGVSRIDIVEYLVEHGANVRQRNHSGETCLMFAVLSESLCGYLISQGVDVKARDLYGRTALHYAIEGGNSQTVQLLLEHGADPFAETRYGNDPLQTACLTGALSIAHYFIIRYNYTAERLADTLELLGTTMIDTSNTQAVMYWRLANQLRWAVPRYIQKRPEILPRSAFENRVEFSTGADLDAIAVDEDAIRYQGLIILERILGIGHEHTIQVMTDVGYQYEHSVQRDSRKCMDMWLLALQMRVQKHSILHYKTCTTARSIVRLMENVLHRNVTQNDPNTLRFEDVFAMFQLLVSNILETRHLLSVQPISRVQQDNHDNTVRCLTHLIYLLLSTAGNQTERRLVESSVRDLLRHDIRCVRTNESLLHLSVSRLKMLESEYVVDKSGTVGIFPNVNVTNLLLECGADVDAFDRTKSTPLHTACLPLNHDREVVRALVEHGAHLDRPNLYGDSPASLLAGNLANDVVLGKHISLKCICANTVVGSGIPYQGIVHRMLEGFIRAHEPV